MFGPFLLAIGTIEDATYWSLELLVTCTYSDGWFLMWLYIPLHVSLHFSSYVGRSVMW